MLLPPLCAASNYVSFASEAGLKVFSEPLDISKEVAKTWWALRFFFILFPSLRIINGYFRDISWSLIQNPALWSFALAQGRDGLAFLQSFRAMRRGFANGSFRYAVMVFEK